MITKFDSRFAGDVDMDDVGYGGVPEKRYPALDRVLVQEWVGVPQFVCLEQLERFAAEVMPAFQKAKVVEPAIGLAAMRRSVVQ